MDHGQFERLLAAFPGPRTACTKQEFPMGKLPAATALLLIDVQQAFDDPRWGARNNPEAEARIAELLAAFRAADRPVLHVKHDSTEPRSTLQPGQPGNAGLQLLQPGLRVLGGIRYIHTAKC